MMKLFITLVLLPMVLSIQHFHADPSSSSAMTLAARYVAASKIPKPSGSSIFDLLGMKHVPADQLDLQLGDNYTEMDEIAAGIDTVLDDLQSQDTEADNLVAGKTANHSDAVAATGAANSSLTAAHTAHEDDLTQLATEQASLATVTETADESIARGNTELTFVDTMEQALDGLIAVGAEPNELIAISSMANELADRHPTAVAELQHSVSLVQRPHDSEVLAVRTAFTNLIASINQKKLEAQESVVHAQALVDAASAAVVVAAANVVLMKTRQAAAMAAEYAALQDLETTKADVVAEKEAREETRQELLAIKEELVSLGAVADTDTNFAQVLSLLAVGASTGKYDDILAAIQTHLISILSKIDMEEFSEQTARNNRFSEWSALKAAETPLVETSNVKTAALATLDTNIAQAQGVLDSANSALQEEIDHQLREKSFFTQLRDLLEALPAMMVAGSDTSLVQVDRAHTDFTTQFEHLIAALEADMVSTKSSLQTTRDREAQDHTDLVSGRVAVALEAEQAETAEQNAIAATQAAQQVYLTASQRYNANYVLRTEERTIIMRIQTLVANLGSA